MLKMVKLSILMPTYNDASSICETLNSIIKQTYSNWELIIIDDGSTDNTKEVIEEFVTKNKVSKKVKYIYQENQDQLKALINGMQYIKGKYVYILHSDDLFYDKDTVSNAINYLEENSQVDAIIGDLTIIDENSNITGVQKTLDYINKDSTIATQLLWLGRNLYIDLSFCKTEVFKKEVYNNYLLWNRSFWLNITENKANMLNVKKLNFCFSRYRIHSNNYANNELGKLCLINGELRTATRLMRFYNIPLYKIQYIIFRVFINLKLFKYYKPIYQNKETKNKKEIVEFIINKRYQDDYKKYEFLSSLINFYKNYTHRTINFEHIYNGKDKIYLGNDLRIFNRQMIDKKLPDLYYKMFKEMDKGFDEIEVSEKNKQKVKKLLEFLCIYPYVKIRSSKNEKKDS